MIFITGPLCSGKKEAAKNILRCDGEAYTASKETEASLGLRALACCTPRGERVASIHPERIPVAFSTVSP